jgi:short subunit dehydrogenase-like uncharacterized protein
VVFGATGFTGVAASIWRRACAQRRRLALAGRQPAKLAALKQELSARGGDAGAIGCSRRTWASRLAREARRVGARRADDGRALPPLRRGPGAGLRARAGTNVDLTGEGTFVDRMLERYDADARAQRRAHRAHACGFDRNR